MQRFGNSAAFRWQANLQSIVSNMDVPVMPRLLLHDGQHDRFGLALHEFGNADIVAWRDRSPVAPAADWHTLKSTRQYDATLLGRNTSLFDAYLDLNATELLVQKQSRATEVVSHLRENGFGIVGVQETFPVKQSDISALCETYRQLGCQTYKLPALYQPDDAIESRYILIVKPHTRTASSRINHP